ncbi:MAG TPA: IS21 family transposase [Candidatus Dormibacteraeota bacterium]|nr:IS21 family transposase [Candidatus Dormibacteraeota bacterium]
MNVLKSHLRITIQTLLGTGVGQREIERITGVDRKTIRRYERAIHGATANSPTLATGSDGRESAVLGEQTPPPRPPGRPPKLARSACEAHRAWIEEQVQLGRNAQSISQDLVERVGFTHRYNSVKRFVRTLRARDPERFDILESLPGEEAQVDLGLGAPTLHRRGKYRRPYLFVMTLKYSSKAFRKVVWKIDQQSWARLHEEAFRAMGGAVAYVVLDNLKQGVIKPDLYEPELNPVYAAMLAHHGAVADVARVADPNRKGAVERAIQHTQDTALKGRRFESIEEQNAWLCHWEERWAAPRIHGRKKRQVLALFLEEKPHLLPLPLEPFRYFRQETRTVDDAGLVPVDASHYSALPAPLYSEVTVRIYEREVEILDERGTVLRRHEKSTRKGAYVLPEEDRIFNPSRQTAHLIGKARKIGPHCAQLAREIFARLGRPGQKAIYGLANLARHHSGEDIERACERVLSLSQPSYQALKRILQASAAAKEARAAAEQSTLQQRGDHIRAIEEYQRFFDQHSAQLPLLPPDPPTNTPP